MPPLAHLYACTPLKTDNAVQDTAAGVIHETLAKAYLSVSLYLSLLLLMRFFLCVYETIYALKKMTLAGSNSTSFTKEVT